MARDDVDRNLLFGLLAIQSGLIDRAALLEGLRAWTLDKSRPLAEILADRGALPTVRRTLLEALIDEHIRTHEGELTRSLAAVDLGKSTLESLAAIGDPDLDATLQNVGTDTTEPVQVERIEGFDVSSSGVGAGRFRILRPHARGGLGAVFVALDAELNREVALKQILDRHADDPASRSRFLLEAEITGGLEHPGIVPVYALGTFSDGRPYYAMRFIRGDSLKDAIARYHRKAPAADPAGSRELELRKLLRRFLDVCNAIEYAHQRGVLHRDLKPGNVMVGKYGETLVVDWGLAKAVGMPEPVSPEGEKAIHPSHSSGTAETIPGHAIGTPAYMSPEQADGELERIGVRSDVYSLGATLYCLLTGRPPYEGPDAGAVLHLVRQGGLLFAPRKHVPKLDPALEAICLKAMAHKPEDRYATPASLAEEVDRWMADEPVTAFPEPRSRRVARWARRHASLVAGGGVFLAASVVGLTLVASLVTRQNRRLEAANLETKAAGSMAHKAVRTMLEEVSRDDLLNIPQGEGLRVSLAERALEFYREFAAKHPDDPDFLLEQARVEEAVAGLYRMTGKFGPARMEYDKSIAILNDLLGRDPASTIALLCLSWTEGQLAEMIKMAGGTDLEAEPHHREGIRIAERLWSLHPDVPKYAKMLAVNANDLADTLVESGRADEAEPLLGPGLAAALAFQASLPSALDPKVFNLEHILLPMIRTTRGSTLAELDRRAEAEAELLRSIGSLRELHRVYPQSNDFQFHLANGLKEWGDLQAASPDRRPEALRSLDEAITLVAQLVEQYPRVGQYPKSLVSWRILRGTVRLAAGLNEPAIQDLESADTTLAERLRVEKAAARPLREHAQVKAALARLASIGGRRAAALKLADEAITIQERALVIDPSRPIDRSLLQQHQALRKALAGAAE